MTTTPEEPREQDKAGSSTTDGLMRPDMREVEGEDAKTGDAPAELDGDQADEADAPASGDESD